MTAVVICFISTVVITVIILLCKVVDIDDDE